MATEIHVPSALPSEMQYGLPPSLPSAKSTERRFQPINAQSFQAGNVIQFDIACGGRGQYIDPSSTYLRFKITYTHAGANGTDYGYLLGSSYSPFIKQEVYGNNSVLLESINECGVLANMLLNCQLNDADKRGLSPAFGFDGVSAAAFSASSTAGHKIYYDALNQNLEFEYCCPIIGILGSGTDKFIPVGAFYGLRLEYTCDNVSNFVKDITANLTTGYTISEVELVCQYIELAPEAQMLIESANPEKIHIRSQSYKQASNLLGSSSGVGTYDLLVGLRLSSLKSLYVSCWPANANEGKYAGVNPNLDQGTCFTIAGNNYPQRTLSPSKHPADCFIELSKSFGALGLAVFNGCVPKNNYYRSSTAFGLMQAYTTAVANIQSSPNQFFLGIDTEVVQRKASLLSGINVNSSPLFFRAQVGSALSANNHVLNFYGYYDLILEIDVQQKNIIAKF